MVVRLSLIEFWFDFVPLDTPGLRVQTHWTACQNLSGPSKNLDKIGLCQIFNLSSVGALRQRKIFVNHKGKSHGSKHHSLRTVSEKGYMRSQESWAYGDR